MGKCDVTTETSLEPSCSDTETLKPWLEGEGWYHQSHFFSHSFGNPVGRRQVEPNLRLGIHWEEKQGLCFHVAACLPQIYEVIQPDLCWLSTWDDSMMNFLKGHNSLLAVFLHTTLQDKRVPVVVFAFLNTTEFIASHCLPHF